MIFETVFLSLMAVYFLEKWVNAYLLHTVSKVGKELKVLHWEERNGCMGENFASTSCSHAGRDVSRQRRGKEDGSQQERPLLSEKTGDVDPSA